MQNAQSNNGTSLISRRVDSKLAELLAELIEERTVLDRALKALDAYSKIVATPLTTPGKSRRRGRPLGSKNRPKHAPFSAKTVLVVADEPVILEFTRDLLHTAGFQVLTALNTSQALELCSSGTEQIDVLLTDVRMPQMTGIELARHFSDRNPGAPIVFMAGDITDLEVTGMADQKVLLKPLKPHALFQMLQESLT